MQVVLKKRCDQFNAGEPKGLRGPTGYRQKHRLGRCEFHQAEHDENEV